MPSRVQSRSPVILARFSPFDSPTQCQRNAFLPINRAYKCSPKERYTGSNWSIRYFVDRRHGVSKPRNKVREWGCAVALYNGWRGVLIRSSGDTLAVETVPKGPETTIADDDAFVGDTTTLLKGPTAIVDAGEIKLTLAVADAVELPEAVVTVLELDAEPSIFLDSILSVNRSIIHGDRLCMGVDIAGPVIQLILERLDKNVNKT